MRHSIWAAAAIVLAAAGSAQAGFTSFTNGGSLTSFINSAYGGTATAAQVQGTAAFAVGSYTFQRVNDNGGSALVNLHATSFSSTWDDNLFSDGLTEVNFIQKSAGNGNTLGWVNHAPSAPPATVSGGNFVGILGDTGSPSSATVTLSSRFQLALKTVSGSTTNYWGSNTATNTPGLNDHLLTWFVTNGSENFFFVAWEDLNLADADYNDWTGEIRVVPLPPAAWAGIGSLACVAGFGVIRRRRLAAN